MALPMFILLPPEPDEDDDEAQDLAEKERYYQEKVAPYLTPTDEDENFPIALSPASPEPQSWR